MLLAKGVTHYFGGLCAVSDFNLDLQPHELVGIIGPNGAGKTTIFNLITGVYKATRGSITMEGVELVGKTPNQVTSLGIARTLIYQGQEDQPLYHVDGSHQLIYGEGDTRDSFFHEYLFKLRHVESRLNTTRARDIAAGRREAAENFAQALKNEVQDAHQQGALLLASALRKFD